LYIIEDFGEGLTENLISVSHITPFPCSGALSAPLYHKKSRYTHCPLDSPVS
jgi:hypothetical protein